MKVSLQNVQLCKCVTCCSFEDSCVEGDVRLVAAPGDDGFCDSVSGEVQVCMNGVFGSVCDSSWDNFDASVVCRQLGFPPYGK